LAEHRHLERLAAAATKIAAGLIALLVFMPCADAFGANQTAVNACHEPIALGH
jgi:hypothetical protein